MQNLKMGILSPVCKQTTPSFKPCLPTCHFTIVVPGGSLRDQSNLVSAQLNLKYKGDQHDYDKVLDVTHERHHASLIISPPYFTTSVTKGWFP